MRRLGTVLALLALAVLLAAVVRFWHLGRTAGPATQAAGSEEETLGPTETVRCYFPLPQGLEPAEEFRQIPPSAEPVEKLRRIMEELHRGPTAPGAFPLFPPGTRLRSSFLTKDGTAYLDYPAQALAGPLGPREEFLLLRCLARTLLRNCPEIRAFVVLVDGSARHRLVLHLPGHGRYLLPKS